MGVMFSGNELVDIAVAMEKRGAVFYETLAEQAEEASAEKTFSNLALMEKRHIDIFEKLRQSLSAYDSGMTHDEEYDQYLKSPANSGIFPSEKGARDIAKKAKDKSEALQYAIWAEKDSILFYQEMSSLIAKQDRPTLEKIIAEERLHLRDLTHMRNMLLRD